MFRNFSELIDFVHVSVCYSSGVGGFIARPPRGRAIGGMGRGIIKQRPGLSSVAKMGQIGSLSAQPGDCK